MLLVLGKNLKTVVKKTFTIKKINFVRKIFTVFYENQTYRRIKV